MFRPDATPNDIMDYVHKKASSHYESYKQENYVYSYIRSRSGYGKECSVVSFPIDYAASVTYGLTLLE